MFTKLASILCTIHILTQQNGCSHVLDAFKLDTNPPIPPKVTKLPFKIEYESYRPVKLQEKPIRRYWLLTEDTDPQPFVRPRVYEDETDTNIKKKIAMLVDQTMIDTQGQMKEVNKIKQVYRDNPSYKAGFILAMVKKSKNILDELFNVAIRHKDEWRAIEHMKIYEMIVHTNIDTSNYLRQLVDVHINQINSTHTENKRIILL